jgi:hypothetical protein
MSRCARIKADGERCKGEAMPGAEWCYSHHPDYKEQRRRNASKGGKRGGRGRRGACEEISEIKALLEELTDRVTFEEGTEYLPANHAAVAAQLINTRLRAIELERKIKETVELEERLEALEQAQQQEGGSKRWGA